MMAEPNTPPTEAPPADNTQAAPPPSPAPGAGTGSPGTPADGTPEPQKAPETKPALTDVPPAAPEFKLESLKMPEGLKLEGDTRGAFEKAIQEGDPNKRAQALLDLYAGEAKKAQAGLYDT